MTIIKKKSPILLIPTALVPLLTEFILLPQKVINRKEHIPTPSQPIKKLTRFDEVTKNTIKNENV